MGIKRAQHAAYDIKYHFVWIPKYRKKIMIDEIRGKVKGLFEEIASQYEFEIDAMEVMPDHVRIFLRRYIEYRHREGKGQFELF